MSSARRCDCCGAIGDPPYAGWLIVSSAKRSDDTIGRLNFGLSAELKFDICGHGCLPELAFVKSAEFAELLDEVAT